MSDTAIKFALFMIASLLDVGLVLLLTQQWLRIQRPHDVSVNRIEHIFQIAFVLVLDF